MTFGAVLDANVLVPARPRDVLLTLADAGLFRPLWSTAILEETVRHLPDSMPVEARRNLVDVMGSAFPEALVTWPEDLWFSALDDINPKDQHVIQAAFTAGADVVVTEDIRLRGQARRSQMHHPDAIDFQSCAEFTACAVDVDPSRASTALESMVRRRWARDEPQTGWDRFLRWTRRQGWTITAEILESARTQ